jgi:hypothetical protein
LANSFREFRLLPSILNISFHFPDCSLWTWLLIPVFHIGVKAILELPQAMLNRLGVD